ncbi:ATPase [Rhizobium sp. P38BS-XIX]|uniref:N-acetylglucosamine kinase n=1 Tax=Rhizobium sp. P38BS-XIX TaxID=2726740 RepID=UPI001456F901|nr:BadF/BadG/BcrA/BcrD ATPase family protein [Rhizobium sp. P38BS-XIX]NLS00761.1 ATPase [Rhizobium sp. P38BS-XIX]
MKQADLIAGIDIGGTKTHVLVKDFDGVVADRVVASADWRVWDREKDAAALAALIKDIAGGELCATAIGAHGCDTDLHCKQLEADLASHLDGRIKVLNDSELLVAAAGFQSGIGVVSGTGSIAVARNANDEMLVAGGWGWILGDEGSAAALVREAARAVRGAIDLGQTHDPLIVELMTKLNISDPTKIGRHLNDTRSAAIWGGYADAVFGAARRGSPLANRVIREGADALAALIGVLISRGADARHVVIGGGVVVEQPMLFDAFVDAMSIQSPASVVTLLRAPPVNGALAIAERFRNEIFGMEKFNGK